VCPILALPKVSWLGVVSVEFGLWNLWVDVSWPYLSIVEEPPKGEVDWDVVDGFEECRDPDGGAVKPLVAVDKYIASPKETQYYLLGNVV
jgi:hypothetical protein